MCEFHNCCWCNIVIDLATEAVFYGKNYYCFDCYEELCEDLTVVIPPICELKLEKELISLMYKRCL